MTHLVFRLARLCCVLLLAAAASAAWADPPSRVGRISLAEGVLSLRHADEAQWSPAGLNFPVIAGDAVWADQTARGEIQFGGAEARIDNASLLTILRLDEEATQLRLDQGVLNLAVRFLPPGGLQVITAVGQLDIRQPGEYHVDAGRPNGPPTQLVMGVLVGEARFSGPRGIVELHSGQGVMIPPDQSQLTVVSLTTTPFDQWAEMRAQTLQTVQSVRYVSAEVTGYQDLDHYGRWEEIPDYGMVWFPTAVEVGWAPYRHGHWAFIRPWGWTWIDDAPWGFAPFHYGRWVLFEGRWAWIPGERRERPCYAPALVAFVGGAPGVEIGVGVSWLPLGPHEVFHPYYPVSEGYLRAVNRPHVANVTQINVTNVTVNNYVNRGAATSVPAAAFTGGQPVHQNLAPPPSFQGRQQPPGILTNLNHLQPSAPAAPAPAAIPAPRQAPFVAPQAPAAPAVQPQAPAVPAPRAAPPAPAAQPQAMPAPTPRPAPTPAPAPPQPQFAPPHPAPQPQQQPAQPQKRPEHEHDHEREH